MKLSEKLKKFKKRFAFGKELNNEKKAIFRKMKVIESEKWREVNRSYELFKQMRTKELKLFEEMQYREPGSEEYLELERQYKETKEFAAKLLEFGNELKNICDAEWKDLNDHYDKYDQMRHPNGRIQADTILMGLVQLASIGIILYGEQVSFKTVSKSALQFVAKAFSKKAK